LCLHVDKTLNTTDVSLAIVGKQKVEIISLVLSNKQALRFNCVFVHLTGEYRVLHQCCVFKNQIQLNLI